MVTQAGLQNGVAKGKPSRPEKAIFRRWQRFRLNLPVRLIVTREDVVTREDTTKITQGRVHDVSEGGVLLFAGIELRTSDEVCIEFTLPYSSTPVRAPGTVRHRRGYTYGVEFRSDTPTDQELVAKFRNLMQLAAHANL